MSLRKRERIRIRGKLWGQQFGLCCWCGRFVPLVISTLEHIVRKVDGGTNAKGNLAMSCGPCNHGRHHAYNHNWHERTRRVWLATRPQHHAHVQTRKRYLHMQKVRAERYRAAHLDESGAWAT